MAVKNGKTKKIQFLKTDKACSYLEKIIDVDSDELVLGEYSFDPKDYLEDAYLSKMMDGSCVEWKAMGDVCDIQRGKRLPKGVKYSDTVTKYPYLRVCNLGRVCVKENNIKYITKNIYDQISNHTVKKGDLLFSSDGTIGLTALVDNKYDNSAFCEGIRILKPINNVMLNNYLLYVCIYKLPNYYKNKISGSAIPHLFHHEFIKFKIPLPPLEIQQKIVTELDQLEDHTKALKQLLEHTKKAKAMYATYGLVKEIRELLAGCEWKALGDVCDINQGDSLTKTQMIDGIYDVIGGGKIIGKHNQKNRDGHDFTLTRVGDININYTDNPYYLTDNGFSLKSKHKNIATKYLYYFLSCNIDYMINLYQGTAQKVISKTNLKSLKIPAPPLEIQEKCIKVYQKKEAMLKEYDKELEKIENDIKHNQELGKQVIEYYITADTKPTDNDTTDSENESGDESSECSEHPDDSHNVEQNKKVKHSKDFDDGSTEQKSKKVIKKVKVTKKESSDDDSDDESTGKKSKKAVKKVKIIKKASSDESDDEPKIKQSKKSAKK